MGLRQLWNSLAVARCHALVVEVPGWWSTRVAVEQALLRRGWPLALSPAEADVLLVCGDPAEPLTRVIDHVWEQMPGPRARAALTEPGVDPALIDPVLDRLAAELADEGRQRHDARDRRDPPADDPPAGEQDDREDHGDMDHGDMDHGDMDHGDMDMAPEGIPLAGGGEDRDGLEMDVLHLPLGPVLPHWPPGLVLRCVLHGDVVGEAEVELLEGRDGPPPPAAAELPAWDGARACDGAARLLALAGWDAAAAQARRARDLLLGEGTDGERVAGQLEELRLRVSRSRTLRWQLKGLGPLDEDAVRRHGLDTDAAGDVYDRLLAMLVRAAAAATPSGPPRKPGAALDALPAIVSGLELAAVRLVVASLDPDTAEVQRSERTHA